jgi:hypothetical protein
MLFTISRTITLITAFSVTKKLKKKPSRAEATLISTQGLPVGHVDTWRAV